METASARGEGVRVAGRIEVMTERPIVLPRPGSPRARAQALLERRRWLLGAALGSIALVVLRSSRTL
jgi:hypothetical protein